jgi:hypothetical protein
MKTMHRFISLLLTASLVTAAPLSNDLSGSWGLLKTTSVGANSLTTNRAPTPLVLGSFIVIDPFSVSCECRKLTSVSGSTLGFTALRNAHAADAAILHVRTSTIPLAFYGAVGNGSANDTLPVQAAFDDQWVRRAQMGIDGGGSTYIVHTPIVAGAGGRLSNCEIKASPAFTPAESTNAVFMNSQGTILPFTGSASTDIITTPSDHEIPSDKSTVMLKNIRGLAGVTAGRIYYTRDRTGVRGVAPFTFKLCATPGGAAIDITSNGSGTQYAEVPGAQRVFLHNVTIDGSTTTAGGVTGTINGMDMRLQQPAEFFKLRVENCNGVGVKIAGQDGIFVNTMIINCLNGMVFDKASYFKFFGFNLEQCDIGVTFNTSATNVFFSGVHTEGNVGAGYATATANYFLVNRAQNLMIDSWHASFNGRSQTMFKSTGTASQNSYTIRGLDCPSTTTGLTMIDDAARGVNLKNWGADDVPAARKFMDLFIAPLETSSPAYPEEGRFQIYGASGKFIKMGSSNAYVPNVIYQARTDQVANIQEWNNKSAARAAYVSPDGAMSSLYQRFGSGTPEGVVTAPVGAVYHRTDGGAATSFYVKESGSGNTGWVAK